MTAETTRLRLRVSPGAGRTQVVGRHGDAWKVRVTEAPEHGGLSEFGKRVVAECNRLGILVDLAHCTDEAVTQALAISKAPMVWSHSSIALSYA